jgi:outer membrane immunogenic protein
MKRLLLGSVGLVALIAAGSANAADVPAYGPPPPPVLVPIYNWTGFYVGGNIGGAWRHGDNLADTLFGVNFDDGNNRGVLIGGGQIGVNYQCFNNFVVGVEWDFDWNANNNNTTTILTAVGPLQATVNNRWVSTLAARFGWALDRWLLYGKAGGGWVGNDNFTITNTQIGASFNFSNTANNTPQLTGWLVGVGAEWAFAGNWSARVEYDYLGLSSRTFNGDGVIFPVNDTFSSGNRNVQMVTFGINYRFGWGDPVASY